MHSARAIPSVITNEWLCLGLGRYFSRRGSSRHSPDPPRTPSTRQTNWKDERDFEWNIGLCPAKRSWEREGEREGRGGAATPSPNLASQPHVYLAT